MSERGKKLTGLSIAIFSLGIKGIPLLEKQKKRKGTERIFGTKRVAAFRTNYPLQFIPLTSPNPSRFSKL